MRNHCERKVFRCDFNLKTKPEKGWMLKQPYDKVWIELFKELLYLLQKYWFYCYLGVFTDLLPIEWVLEL